MSAGSGRDPQDWIDIVTTSKSAPGADDPVLSPCVGVCLMDEESGLCRGCLRTLDEIAAWSGASNDERRAIRAALPARRPRMKNPW